MSPRLAEASSDHVKRRGECFTNFASMIPRHPPLTGGGRSGGAIIAWNIMAAPLVCLLGLVPTRLVPSSSHLRSKRTRVESIELRCHRANACVASKFERSTPLLPDLERRRARQKLGQRRLVEPAFGHRYLQSGTKHPFGSPSPSLACESRAST